MNRDTANHDTADHDTADHDTANHDTASHDTASHGAPPAGAGSGHRRRRRAALVTAVATATALAVLGPTALAHRAHPVTVRSADHVASSAAGRLVTNARSHHAVLPGGTWTALPEAPIVSRSDGVGVWTGGRLLVWGGTSSTGEHDYADGATYDPVRRTWAVLPRSPLSARAEMASVWTGHVLYVWGGQNARGTARHDGAAYDPAHHRWTLLPRPPIPSYASVQTFWTGGRLVLLTRPTGDSAAQLDLQAFDPHRRTWTVLPRLKLPARHPALDSNAVRAGGQLYVWSEWLRTTKVRGGYSGTFGIDSYRFDLRRHRWTAAPFSPPAHDVVTDPVWTGREILLPAAQLWCGFCPGPIQVNSTGLRLDPHTGRARTIPHGPADDLNGQYLWTGAVLLAVNTDADVGGIGGVHPGVAAYWRPSTNRWTLLPPAPLAGDAVSVWTGTAVLVWGNLSPTAGVDGAAKNTHGLQLSR